MPAQPRQPSSPSTPLQSNPDPSFVHFKGSVSRCGQHVQTNTTAISPACSSNWAISRSRCDPHAMHRTSNLRNGLSAGVWGGW
ncbi:MAG: hypothetical protein ABSC01_10635 [Verrucomicrobiota bacterium]